MCTWPNWFSSRGYQSKWLFSLVPLIWRLWWTSCSDQSVCWSTESTEEWHQSMDPNIEGRTHGIHRDQHRNGHSVFSNPEWLLVFWPHPCSHMVSYRHVTKSTPTDFTICSCCWQFNSSSSDYSEFWPIVEGAATNLMPSQTNALNTMFLIGSYQLTRAWSVKNVDYHLSSICRKKRTKWGIKVWECCDSHTGFIYSFDVYTGADPSKPTHPKGLAYDVVLELFETQLGKGHAVYMDTFYSSPELFEDLLVQNTAVSGTVRTNRRNFPKLELQLFCQWGSCLRTWVFVA